MVISTEPVIDLENIDLEDVISNTHDDAVVYGDMEGETVLHEGAVTLLANGWIELPTGRLLSPEAVHHIDTVPTSGRSDPDR